MDADALLRGLNPPQREAVAHRGGPLLVLAGAGSGKTRVITVRMAHLMATGVEPEHILALTFTNKAADEMAERLAGLVGPAAADRATVGTFHSLGLRLVEEAGASIGLPRPVTLLDAADQKVAVRQCLKDMRIDPRRHDPRTFLGAISNARTAGLTPGDVAGRPGQRYVAGAYKRYLDWLEAHRVLDFDDLLLRPVQIMREKPELLARWRARYRAILVDEFQDTNAIQLELVRLLAEEHRHLCVVGDDDQSIYGWRGAVVENILEFERHFPDARVVALEQNYRSTGHILSAANAVIARNAARKEKALWSAAGEGERVRVVSCRTPDAEAAFVAAEIGRLRAARELRWSDFGVLFRASAQAAPLEEALRAAGVPYRLVGANEFYERKEIKDVVSYLRLVHQPRDRASFVRVANFPQRGMGPKSLAALLDFADAHRLGPLDACARASEVPGLGAAQAAALEGLARLVREARGRLEGGGRPDLAGVTAWLLERLEARTAWLRDPTEGPGGETRWRNVEALLRGMQRWQRRSPGAGVGEWLTSIALMGREDEGEAADEVVLMTIHKAKGLEWPVCFTVGCQDGFLPHQRTLDEGADLSEERRLFYVAITRARRELVLSWSRRRRTAMGDKPSQPSRFLKDVPEAHRVDAEHGDGGGDAPDGAAGERPFADLAAQLRAKYAARR